VRISNAMQTNSIATSLQSVESQYQAASQVASSWSRINAPSDDPVGAAQLARVQASIDQTTTYQNTITSVQGDLTLTESSLASAGDVIGSAKELALEASDGSLTATQRQSIGTQVAQLQSQLLSIANQKDANGYIFSGSQTGTAAFSDTGVYQGDTADRTAEIGQGNTAVVNVTGAKAFTAAGGVDVFATLGALQTALNSNDMSGISSSVSALDSASSQISVAQSDAGIKLDRLTTAGTAHQQTQLSLASQRHDIADADPAQAYSQLTTLQNALEQAIATSRITLSTLSANRFQ
jgi:flagellar hook-associated protein 3 FlgL